MRRHIFAALVACGRAESPRVPVATLPAPIASDASQERVDCRSDADCEKGLVCVRDFPFKDPSMATQICAQFCKKESQCARSAPLCLHIQRVDAPTWRNLHACIRVPDDCDSTVASGDCRKDCSTPADCPNGLDCGAARVHHWDMSEGALEMARVCGGESGSSPRKCNEQQIYDSKFGCVTPCDIETESRAPTVCGTHFQCDSLDDLSGAACVPVP